MIQRFLIQSLVVLILLTGGSNSAKALGSNPFADRSLPDTSELTIPRHTIDTGPIRSDSVIIRYRRTLKLESGINDLAFSSTGERLAIASDENIRVFKTSDYSELSDWSVYTEGLSFTPDGKYLVSQSGHHSWGMFTGRVSWGWINVWDPRTGEKIRSIGGEDVIPAMIGDFAFSRDGERLAVGDFSGLVALWDTSQDPSDWTKTMTLGISEEGSTIGTVDYHPDGERLLASRYSSSKGKSLLWDVTEKKKSFWSPVSLLHAIDGQWNNHHRRLQWFAKTAESISPDGRKAALWEGTKPTPDQYKDPEWLGVEIADIENPKRRVLLSPPNNYFKTYGDRSGNLIFSNDSRLFIGGGRGLSNPKTVDEGAIKRGDVLIWTIENQERLPILHGHELQVNSIAYHPKKDRFATASEDGTVKIWDVEFLKDAWD